MHSIFIGLYLILFLISTFFFFPFALFFIGFEYPFIMELVGLLSESLLFNGIGFVFFIFLVSCIQYVWLRHIKRKYASEINPEKRVSWFWLILTLVFPFSVITYYVMPMIMLVLAYGGMMYYLPFLFLGIPGVYFTISNAYLYKDVNKRHLHAFYFMASHLIFSILLFFLLAFEIIEPLGRTH